MATGNKSLGRFKLTGIPPAPRGIPQIQVAFDIDANGILQVNALDRTTGREQSITVQGASTLGEEEVRRMIRDAEQYAETDRLKKEKVEKRTKSEALTFQAERQLREATLDFGMQFVSSYRARIEAAIGRLRTALAENDERAVDRAKADLEDAVYDLNREVYQRNKEEQEQDSLFGAIKSFFTDDDDDYYNERWDSANDRYSNTSGRSDYSNRYGGDRYSNDRPSTDRYGGDRYGNDRYANNRYGNDRFETERDTGNLSNRSYTDRSSSGSYDDRNRYTPRDRQEDDFARDRRSAYDSRLPERDSRPDRDEQRSERSDRRSARPPRNARPNLYQDNWDDDDDWL
jgi:molecular chaperone DnaK